MAQPQLNKGTVYSTVNSTVTIDNLNQLVDNATLLPGAISEQAALFGNAAPASDQVLILASGQLKKASVVQALGGVTPSELLNRNNNLSDLANVATAKTNLSLNNVENKSSATIRGEITSGNVTTALGYIPPTPTELSNQINTRIATAQLGALNGVATLGSDGKLSSNQVAALNSTAQLAVLGTQALGAIGAQPLLTLPLSVAQGGTGQTASTGSGAVVLANSPTLVTPALGTPSSGNLANCTIPISSVTGYNQTLVQTYSTPGTFTWTKPVGAKSVHVVAIGGGAAGKHGATTANTSPQGGLAGGLTIRTLSADLLSATETVTVGAGGVPSLGGPGTAGGFSSFGSYVYAGGGEETPVDGAASTSNVRQIALFQGGNRPSGTSTNFFNPTSPSSGGNGGQRNSYTTTGGSVLSFSTEPFAGSAPTSSTNIAAAAGTTASLNGLNGFSAPVGIPLCGGGGGGGYGNLSGQAGNGGAGGLYGGGGGGGGTSNVQNGLGGAGAQGIVVVTTYF